MGSTSTSLTGEGIFSAEVDDDGGCDQHGGDRHQDRSEKRCDGITITVRERVMMMMMMMRMMMMMTTTTIRIIITKRG